MKLRAPPQASGPFTHKGRLLDLDAQDCVDLPEHEAEALLAHGFRRLDRCAAPSLAAMTRQELVARVMDLTAASVAAVATEDLRRRLRAVDDKPQLPDETLGSGVAAPDDVDETDVARMNRVELFAFLRRRGVSAPPPIRNEELRARARAALAQKAGDA